MYLDEWFKWIRWYEWYYSINNKGTIASYYKKNGRKGRLLKEYPQSFLTPQVQNKALIVNLNNGRWQKRFKVKKLVAEAFMGYDRASKTEVCHKDRDFRNCSSDNLFFSDNHSATMKHYSHTPEWEKKHFQLQIQQIEKRQAKIENQKEKIDKELAEAKEYFKKLW